MLSRSGLLLALLVFFSMTLGACGGDSTQEPGFVGDQQGLDTRDLRADAADLKDALVELKPNDTTPPDVLPDLRDTVPEVAAPDTLPDLRDTAPDAPDLSPDIADVGPDSVDTIPACGGPCGPYNYCDLDSNLCVPNPDCATAFCGDEAQGMTLVQVEGRSVFVDNLEWPGATDALPLTGVGLEEARGLCVGAAKRLCTTAELTAACGEAGKFPYGAAYQGASCNTEPPFKLALCGSFAACHAPAVLALDLVGNAAEWTAEGTLYGGSCRDGATARCAATTVPEGGYPHPELVGFRCCTAPDDDLDDDGAPASLDCDEADPTVHHGATETCDGRDENCNLRIDDVEDGDQDGFDACLDCNDNLASINPGALDLVGDDIDLDCDGVDGADRDGDGHLSVATGGDDCDDHEKLVHPGLPDLCDGLDNDCDGHADSPLPEGECDDALACTTDSCDAAAKACVNAPLTCDDADPCTDQDCQEPGGCQSWFNVADCEDGDPCTLGDRCQGGACKGGAGALDCNDQNDCTTDLCVAETGCENRPRTALCDDKDPCTVGDSCKSGVCTAGGIPLSCDDDNPCTEDRCVKGEGCQHLPTLVACNDQDPCTTGESCATGVCGGGQLVCDCQGDGDCTVHDDGNLCNGVYRCQGNKCVFDPDSVVVCDDPPTPGCSEYWCKPEDGQCRFRVINNNGPCQDGNGCTVDDKCASGTCVGSTCAAKGLECYQDACVTCAPKCSGKSCGSDACGGSCGACEPTQVCTTQGQCCTPNCTGKECGDDGCGGSCGGCKPGLSCEANKCRGCGDTLCEAFRGETMCTCMGDCGNPCTGKQCGTNQCNWSCGTCQGPQDACINNQCICQPNCVGKVCGPDGCGGSCGTCSGGLACESGKCKGCGDTACEASRGETKCNCSKDCGQPCTGKVCGPDGCGNSCGTCSGTQDLCSAQGLCVCQPACNGKNCGPDGCGGTCGPCTNPKVCLANQTCCTPNCSGKTCGSDGCGGTCGSCTNPAVCNAGSCCTPKCTRDTYPYARECGSDSCGGVCGTCPANKSCSAWQQCISSSAPANDTCSGAISMPFSGPGSFSLFGSTQFSTNNYTAWCISAGGPENVYAIYVPASISSMEIFVSATFSSALTLTYNICGGSALACTKTTSLSLPFPAQGNYYLMVEGQSATDKGDYLVSVMLK